MTSTTQGRRRDALEDSKSVLRQVSGALQDLGVSADSERSSVRDACDPERVPMLASTLIKAYVEINGLIDMLRDSRDVLEQAALHRLQHTNQKLQDVTSATESAATGMLDGVDKVGELLGRLGGEESGNDQQVIDEIHDELHTLVMHMQFQDITSQQLGYASSVLQDLEDRLGKISAIFGSDLLTEEEKAEIEHEIEDALDGPVTCDPNASLGDAEARQSLADSIFG